MDGVIPKLVFIVPYRDRELQLNFFQRHMKYILEDYDEKDYKIFIVHQKDQRSFNRGALKNIGFLITKDLYPDDYKDITLVFNDLDTLPYVKNFIDYKTDHNKIKHFYGVKFTLGGIFSIKGNDFEKINGFPNFWSWGYEDNLIHKRCQLHKIDIDRSVFYPMHDGHIIHLSDGTLRYVNQFEYNRYTKYTPEGINSITNLEYTLEENNMVSITNFHTGQEENKHGAKMHDLKKGKVPFLNGRNQRNPTMNMMTNIQ